MADKCFAHFHMTMEEFGLWNYARSVSAESGKFYLSGRGTASCFYDTDKNAVYRVGDSLLAKGWFKLLKDKSRHPKTGSWIPKVVYPLSHDEWIVRFTRTFCRVTLDEQLPVPKSGQDTGSLSLIPTTPVPNLNHACPESSLTCPENGTKLDIELESKLETKTKKRFRSSNKKTSGQDKLSPEAESLINTLALIADNPRGTFDRKQQQVISSLLAEHSPDDITAAWREAWNAAEGDDFQEKHAARKFIDTAGQLLATKKKQREEVRKIDKLKEEIMSQGQQQAALELAEIRKQAQDEAALVEDTL